MTKAEKEEVIEQTSSSISLGEAASSGVAWTTVQGLLGRFSIFIGQLVLARILMPEDFGILSLAITISEFFGVLTNLGIGQVLQQRQPRMHLWATQAFWISFGLALVAAIAMAIYAPIGAKVYHNDKIMPLVWVMAIALPISALSTVPQTQLQAKMRFKFLAAYSSLELMISQILIIFFALSGMGPISFVLPAPLMASARTIVLWRMAPMPLRPLRMSKGWDRMMKRGSSIFGGALLSTCIGQGDYITLGLLASAKVVGIYFFAYKLASQPMLMLGRSFSSVLSTTLIAMKGNTARQNSAALKTAKLVGLVSTPVCFLQAAVTKPVLVLLFGERWLDPIPLIQILSVSFPLETISLSAAALLAARGQFGRSFKYQLISAPIFFLLVGAGALIASSLGVAIGVAIFYVVHPIFYTSAVFYPQGIKMKEILGCFYWPVLLSGATIGAGYFIAQAPVFQNMLVVQITVTTFVGGCAYALAFRYFSPALFHEVWVKLRGLARRK